MSDEITQNLYNMCVITRVRQTSNDNRVFLSGRQFESPPTAKTAAAAGGFPELHL